MGKQNVTCGPICDVTSKNPCTTIHVSGQLTLVAEPFPGTWNRSKIQTRERGRKGKEGRGREKRGTEGEFKDRAVILFQPVESANHTHNYDPNFYIMTLSGLIMWPTLSVLTLSTSPTLSPFIAAYFFLNHSSLTPHSYHPFSPCLRMSLVIALLQKVHITAACFAGLNVGSSWRLLVSNSALLIEVTFTIINIF